MPRTGAFAVVVIWYQLEAPSGACALVLAPVRAITRYQIPFLAPNPGQRYQLLLQPVLTSVPAATAADTFGLELWPIFQ